MHVRPAWGLAAAAATAAAACVALTNRKTLEGRRRAHHRPEQYDCNSCGHADYRYGDTIARATDYVRRFQTEYGVPGISIAVSVDGKIVWKDGFGYSNVEQLTLCHGDTVMRIASISKPITMALAARLWQEGRLDLDAPISKYLPDFPEKRWDGAVVQITARQLASHRGGIRHYKTEKNPESGSKEGSSAVSTTSHEVFDEMPEYSLNRKFRSVTESLSLFKDDDLVAKPGTKFVYTTHGYTLLSAVIEKAAGVKFEVLLRRMLDSFGMDSTILDENAKLIPERAAYYTRTASPRHRLRNVSEVDLSYKWAGGGLVSTVGDLLTFANVILYGHQCGDQPAGHLGEQRNDDGGADDQTTSFGASRVPRRGYAEHGGGAVGATSALLVWPRDGDGSSCCLPRGVAVAVLVNLQECGGVMQLATSVAKEFVLSREKIGLLD